LNEYINAINDAYAEIEEKKRLMIDSDKELDGVKANVSEKKIELTTLEVKIEMLNRRQKKTWHIYRRRKRGLQNSRRGDRLEKI